MPQRPAHYGRLSRAPEPRALRAARAGGRPGGAARAARAPRRRPPGGDALGRQPPAARSRDLAARATRRCCSSTSRPRRSTRASAAGSGRRRAASATAAAPSSSSPRTSRTSSTSPTGSLRCSTGQVVFDGPVAAYLTSEAAGRSVRPLLILRKDLLVLRRSPRAARRADRLPARDRAADRADRGVREREAARRARRPRRHPATVTVARRELRRRRADPRGREERRARADVARTRPRSSSPPAGSPPWSTVPPGSSPTLKGLVASPHLTLATGTGGITPRVRQQMQALVYNLNLPAPEGVHRGRHPVREPAPARRQGPRARPRLLDHRARRDGAAARAAARLAAERRRSRDFVDDARLALALTTTRSARPPRPIVLDEETGRGRTSALSAQVQAYGLAITITFLGLLLAAGALAAERDENAIGRLVRGLVGLGRARRREDRARGRGRARRRARDPARLRDRRRGGRRRRRPAVAAAAARPASASRSRAQRVGAVGALVGALARESRTASLVGVLVVLPVVFLGLVPREIVPVAAWITTPSRSRTRPLLRLRALRQLAVGRGRGVRRRG